jgi:hypothetical protein
MKARLPTNTGYKIRVRGRFDDQSVARLADVTDKFGVSETVLCGHLDDQAELHGLLERLQDMGFELLAVRREL